MRGVPAALLACSMALAGGCSSDDGGVEAEFGPSAAATSVGSAPSSSDDAGTPLASSATIPYDLVTLTSSCEQYVPLASFTGDLEMQALWLSLTQDPVVLEVWCSEVGNSDPARLVPMVDGLERLRTGLEPTTEHAPTLPVDPDDDPTLPTDATPSETATQSETATTPAGAPAPVTSAALPRVERGVMPAVVCLTLAEAEQQLARAGEYSPTALDLAGGADADDPDVLSIVVTQSPRAGAALGDAEVRLGVVAPGLPTRC